MRDKVEKIVYLVVFCLVVIAMIGAMYLLFSLSERLDVVEVECNELCKEIGLKYIRTIRGCKCCKYTDRIIVNERIYEGELLYCKTFYRVKNGE